MGRSSRSAHSVHDPPGKDQELVGHPDPLIVGPPSVVASDAGELLPS